MPSFWVYVLKCSDGSLYTGYTKDLTRRLKQHASGRGAKYLRGRRPFDLFWTQAYASQRLAMACEAKIKKMPRPQKLAWLSAAANTG
jgi:putative endonuclease